MIFTRKQKVFFCSFTCMMNNDVLSAEISLYRLALGVIQQLHGPNFTHFWPLPPSSGQTWIFYTLSSLCHVNPCGLSTDPLPTLLVHVVIE